MSVLWLRVDMLHMQRWLCASSLCNAERWEVSPSETDNKTTEWSRRACVNPNAVHRIMENTAAVGWKITTWVFLSHLQFFKSVRKSWYWYVYMKGPISLNYFKLAGHLVYLLSAHFCFTNDTTELIPWKWKFLHPPEARHPCGLPAAESLWATGLHHSWDHGHEGL